ncbi:nuclear transport factor 2 family protein [Comamonas humi]
MTNDLQSLQLSAPVQRYFDVLYTCDLDLFDRLFHPACHLFTVADGKETVLSAQAYRDILEKRASPQSQGAPREEAVLGVHSLSPDIALVQVRVRVGTKVFRDHLHFVRSQGEWRLAAKLYTLESGA